MGKVSEDAGATENRERPHVRGHDPTPGVPGRRQQQRGKGKKSAKKCLQGVPGAKGQEPPHTVRFKDTRESGGPGGVSGKERGPTRGGGKGLTPAPPPATALLGNPPASHSTAGKQSSGLRGDSTARPRVCPATLQFASEITAGKDQGLPGAEKTEGGLGVKPGPPLLPALKGAGQRSRLHLAHARSGRQLTAVEGQHLPLTRAYRVLKRWGHTPFHKILTFHVRVTYPKKASLYFLHVNFSPLPLLCNENTHPDLNLRKSPPLCRDQTPSPRPRPRTPPGPPTECPV